MPEKLYLVGTVHGDLKGYRRTERLLNLIMPDIVSIEHSPSTIGTVNMYPDADQEKRVGKVMKTYAKFNPDRETVGLMLDSLLYEITAPLNYCWRNSKLLSLDENMGAINVRIDGKNSVVFELLGSMSSMSRQYISSEMEAAYNTVIMASKIAAEIAEYDAMRKIFETSEARDAHREKKIRQMDGIVVAMAGLNHVYGPYNNLYERLNDLNPIRMTLAEVDHMT